jgi:hypothetical protein
MLFSHLTPTLPHSPIKTIFFRICPMPCHAHFAPLYLIPLSCTTFIYISASCCCFPPFLRVSSFLSISFFLSSFLQSCICVLSFLVYVCVVMLSWFFSFVIHNVSSFTIKYIFFSQCVLFFVFST